MKKKRLSSMLLISIMTLVLCSCGTSQKQTDVSEESNAKEQVEETETAASEESELKETLLSEKDNIVIKAFGPQKVEDEWKMNLEVENKTDKNITVVMVSLKVNDIAIDGAEAFHCLNGQGVPNLQQMAENGLWAEDVGVGEKKEISDIMMYIGNDLERHEIKEVEKISLQVGIFATEGEEYLFTTENVEIPVQ